MSAIIAFITSAEFVRLVLTFIFGGGLVSLYKTKVDSKTAEAHAKAANMKTPVEIESLQVQGLETLAKNLQEDNDVLRAERAYWKEEHDKMKQEVERLSVELERQETRNAELRRHIEMLQKSMDDAEKRSPAYQAGRTDLMGQD